ncbi:MAG: hypothetical protein KatS3mg117_1857 [Geminicoccaceae bacterium]|jgi:hypothetical protein|nr:MAG: hypothetical protein KatS3mg117_1857 [Geminicoccaceae bacterium]
MAYRSSAGWFWPDLAPVPAALERVPASPPPGSTSEPTTPARADPRARPVAPPAGRARREGPKAEPAFADRALRPFTRAGG